MKRKTRHPAIAVHNAIVEMGAILNLNKISYRMYLQLRLINEIGKEKWQT